VLTREATKPSAAIRSKRPLIPFEVLAPIAADALGYDVVPFQLAVVAYPRYLIDLPLTVISYVKTAQGIYRYIYRGGKSKDKVFDTTANDSWFGLLEDSRDEFGVWRLIQGNDRLFMKFIGELASWIRRDACRYQVVWEKGDWSNGTRDLRGYLKNSG